MFLNLATNRQFTNAAWDWIIKKQTNKPKKKERKKKEKKRKEIQIALSLGYPRLYKLGSSLQCPFNNG